jgi:DNA-binding CsgD family transcriptional regulator/tetratricopeptide (TPR) repeat protein
VVAYASGKPATARERETAAETPGHPLRVVTRESGAGHPQRAHDSARPLSAVRETDVPITSAATTVVGALADDGLMPQQTDVTFVGRSAVLDQLSALIGLASRDDAATAVLLGGDAGVGKTRLLTELAREARDAGWRVLVGHCLDFADSSLAYLPFSEMFGHLAGREPALTERLLSHRPEVARLLPGRRMLANDDRAASPGTDLTADRGHLDRAHLMEAVHAALADLTAEAPLLLVVEDAHWADQSTREMLALLFSRPPAGPMAIVASYRSDDLHRRHPLRAAAAEWSRLPTVRRVQLDPLADDDVRRLVLSLHPEPLPERSVRRIIERAEGNAFFTEELVAATAMGQRMLPTDLAELLLVRLDRLDEAARAVVRAAAAAGRRVSDDLLNQVVGLDRTTYDAAVRSAVERNVIVPRRDGYAFRHALLAEAVYDDLLPGERVRLHAAYADALATGTAQGTAAELARHARAAHQRGRALRASVRAGDEAMAVGGPDEAARHYETALELLGTGLSDDELCGENDVCTERVTLTLRVAEAMTAAGRAHRAVDLVRQQLDQLPSDVRPEGRAELLLAEAYAALVAETGVDPLALTTEALELVPTEPSALRARLLAAHALAHVDRGRWEHASRWALEAVQLGEQLHLTDVVAEATTTLAYVDRRSGDPESSRETLEKTIVAARAEGDVFAEQRSLFSLGALHYELGRLVEAQDAYVTAMTRAREVGRPWGPYGFDARVMAAVVAYVRGEWATAEQLVDIRTESPPGLAEALLASIQLLVAAGRGQHRSLTVLPALRPWWDREPMVAIYAASAIDLFGDQQDVDAAVAIHDEVVESVGRVWGPVSFQARVRLGALLLGQLANAAGRAASRRRAELVDLGDRLIDEVHEVVEAARRKARPEGPEGKAWLARADAEHARLHWVAGVGAPSQAELVQRWTDAVAGFERFRHEYELARSRARLAAVLRAAGDTDESQRHADAARVVARRLGAEPLLRELQVPARARPSRHEQRSGRRPEPDASELTPREGEVLALVAQGRSNGEIGRQLFISTKTVSVHVSNILAKLGAAGRTEAVALARQRGLLDDDAATGARPR